MAPSRWSRPSSPRRRVARLSASSAEASTRASSVTNQATPAVWHGCAQLRNRGSQSPNYRELRVEAEVQNDGATWPLSWRDVVRSDGVVLLRSLLRTRAHRIPPAGGRISWPPLKWHTSTPSRLKKGSGQAPACHAAVVEVGELSSVVWRWRDGVVYSQLCGLLLVVRT